MARRSWHVRFLWGALAGFLSLVLAAAGCRDDAPHQGPEEADTEERLIRDATGDVPAPPTPADDLGGSSSDANDDAGAEHDLGHTVDAAGDGDTHPSRCDAGSEPPCDVEVRCIERPLEECEAHGCDLFLAHPYDNDRACYGDEALPAFCRADPDIVCVWEGEPVVLTEPDGTTWYVGWSCFTTPEDWSVEIVSEGRPACH